MGEKWKNNSEKCPPPPGGSLCDADVNFECVKALFDGCCVLQMES